MLYQDCQHEDVYFVSGKKAKLHLVQALQLACLCNTGQLAEYQMNLLQRKQRECTNSTKGLERGVQKQNLLRTTGERSSN